MARFPLRVLGLFLLMATITVASCQAVFHGAELSCCQACEKKRLGKL